MKKVDKLNKKMQECIELEVTEPKLTVNELAERVGVHYMSIYNWKSSPVYKEELNRRLKEVWNASAKIAQEQMIKLAEKGNYKACEFILNNTGYKLPDKVELNSNNSINIEIKEDDNGDKC